MITKKEGNNTNKDDELVKHMRNLPGYLQREEKEENLQGKALNFGVLDWGRLENWKSNEKRIPPRVNMKASSSTNKTPFIKTGSQGVQLSRGKLVQLQDSVAAPRTSDREQKPSWQDTSSSNYSRINIGGGKRIDTDRTTTSRMETSSSESRKNGSQQSSNSSATAQDHCPRGHESVVLLLPKHSPKHAYSRSFNLQKSRSSFDVKMTDANDLRFSDCFSPEELFTEEPFPEIPHSCPLPLGIETIHDSGCPIEIPESMSVTDSSTASESSKRFYHDIAEQPGAKGRPSSPNRRFSFNLGKMTRSLSFKEGSGVPQLSSRYTSVKSGPVKSEASSSFEHLNRDSGNASGRSRSSPLRRLLDPLLKPKGAHSAEVVQLMNRGELLQTKKHGLSCVQALLQLTVKNEVPFFKLVVDNSSDILAAAVKKLPTTGKDDSSLIYSFYSVHEIKKKNGRWMNQGSKEKSVGFGYNVVGQMKVSSSCDQYVVRESVLYSVDSGQADKRMPEFMPNRELAAIIVKDPSGENSDRDGQICKSTVVVLPGGVHSLPSHGVPSPLITRWRSGGSCDCGGWDVGCKLQVLSNREETSEITRPCVPCSSADCLDLFYQGGHEQNKKSFSLALVKNGLYSLEYDTSISLLQAFSICIAVVSSQKLAHIFQVHDLSEAKEEKKFPEAMTDNDRMKAPTTAQGEAPAKYVSYPPASPVGRV